MNEWAEIWVFENDLNTPVLVQDGGGTLEPEEWVRTHGVRNYPNAIYFFAELTTDNAHVCENYYDDKTLIKVCEALAGTANWPPQEIVSKLQNKGILFRERTPNNEAQDNLVNPDGVH